MTLVIAYPDRRLLGRDGNSQAPSTPGSTSGDSSNDFDVESEVQSSSHMRSKLVVTTEVYMRTRTFMEGVQQATVPPLGPLDLSLARDSLFGQFLATYPQPELDWLTCRSVGRLVGCLAGGGWTKSGDIGYDTHDIIGYDS